MQRTALGLCLTIAFTNPNVNAIVFAQAPEQTIQSLLAEARAAQSRRDFRTAADAYRKATELDPSTPELWANLGLMDHEIGKSSDAIQCFKNAIRLNPTLFVPQLFLGIEYLEAKNPEAALPYLERAEKLNPSDAQAALSLGSAYEMLDRANRAAEAYVRATEIVPKDGSAWLHLGTAYLQQVENDARLMTLTYSRSPYVNLRAAEAFAEQGKLVQAESAYQAAIASPSPVPCAHAEFGITLLRRKKPAEAREQFQLEAHGDAHCGLAPLGIAVTDLADGHADAALKGITAIAAADPGFVQWNLTLFRSAVSADQARALFDLAQAQQNSGDLSGQIASLIEKAFLSDDAGSVASFAEAGLSETPHPPSPASAQRFYAMGQYTACDQALKPALHSLTSTRQQLLAFCSFYTGDLRTTSMAAERLKANPATTVQGLYWESKADQKLAVAALNRAGEIDPESPRMHVLIGDVFRQKRRWSDAEAEYRKAVALDPKSRAARLSLAIVLFTELKTDESFQIDQSLLPETPDDPEANLLAGEILIREHEFEKAEPFLSKCQNLKPEMMPRLHVLLGKIYAETDRIPAAIKEYKLGLASDKDGSIHYQLARLYQKTGDTAAAAEQIRISNQLRERWDNLAHVSLEQLSTDVSQQ
jgi:tetratricopeptide (TPR) repeat protein